MRVIRSDLYYEHCLYTRGREESAHVGAVVADDIRLASGRENDNGCIDDIFGSRFAQQCACAMRLGLIQWNDLASTKESSQLSLFR